MRTGRGLDLPLSPERLAQLAPGDRIVLSVQEGVLVRAAAVACLLPVAGLLGGAALARLAGAGEALGPFAAVAGALLGVRLGRRLAAGRARAFLGDSAQSPGDA